MIRKDLAGVEGAEIKIRELQKFIDLQQEQELNNSKEFIEKMIWLELKSRTGGQTARTNASLSKDVQLNAAVDLINNPQQIDSLLKGSN